MQNLPPKPGTCVALARPRLQPCSCCPPPVPEPLIDMDPQAQSLIATRQTQRMLEPWLLLNRLVYDSLEPAACPDQQLPGMPVGPVGGAPGSTASSSAGSSCRTTGSGFTSRSNSTLGDEPCTATPLAPPAGCSQTATEATAAHFAYTPGLVPWYVPQHAADTTLVFESRFESGNLRRAVQVGALRPPQGPAIHDMDDPGSSACGYSFA